MAQARYCPQCPLLTPATPGVPHVWCGVTLQRIGQGRTPSGLRGWLYFCPICGWTGLRRGDRWLSRGLRGAGRPRTPKSAQIAPGGTFNGGKNRGEGQESRPPYGGSPLRGSGSKEPAAPDGAAGIGIGQGDSVPLTPPGRMLKCNCRRRTNVVDAGQQRARARQGRGRGLDRARRPASTPPLAASPLTAWSECRPRARAARCRTAHRFARIWSTVHDRQDDMYWAVSSKAR